jgi:hypothetical protein
MRAPTGCPARTAPTTSRSLQRSPTESADRSSRRSRRGSCRARLQEEATSPDLESPRRTHDRATQRGRYWGRQPPKSKAEFFNAVTTPAPAGEGTIATIRMYGPIDSWGGWWGISTKDVGAGARRTARLGRADRAPHQLARRRGVRGHRDPEHAPRAQGEVTRGRRRPRRVGGIVHRGRLRRDGDVAWHADDDPLALDHRWGNAATCERTPTSSTASRPGSSRSTRRRRARRTGRDARRRDLADRGRDVELGLADRVAVVPDAGEAETVGDDEDDDVVVVFPDDDDEPSPRLARSHAAS